MSMFLQVEGGKQPMHAPYQPRAPLRSQPTNECLISERSAFGDHVALHPLLLLGIRQFVAVRRPLVSQKIDTPVFWRLRLL